MKRTKAVLIVGGSGQIGSHLAMALRDGYKVYATYYRNKIIIPGVTSVPFQVADRNWTKRLAYNIQPDVVIYAAGSNDVDLIEADDRIGDGVHTRGAAAVLGITDVFQPKFILLSNNYVFDGGKGNFKENDTLVPQSALGKYKVSAENYLKGHSLNYVILRSAPIYGRGNGQNFGFFDTIRKGFAKGMAMTLKSDELHNFAPIEGLVELVTRVAESGIKNKILHYGGLTKVTHFEFARQYAAHFGYDPKLLSPAPPGKANEEGKLMDYSINSTQTLQQLKFDPFLLEEGFDLLKKKLVA